MVDNLTSQERTRIMAAVKSKDTTPEKLLRSLLHKKGLRFRLHNNKLPGRPDITLPKFHAVIFMNGCFWHGHPAPDCKLARTPKSNIQFWVKKVEGNQARDDRNRQQLLALGWRVLTVWECSLYAYRHTPEAFVDKLIDWLNNPSSQCAETTAAGDLVARGNAQ